MPQHTLYAYVEGADLEEIATELESRFLNFVRCREWRLPSVWVVNQKHGNWGVLQPGDLPLWDLGLNMALPDPDDPQTDWFNDLEETVLFLARLHEEFNRDFVLGLADSVTEIVKDMFDITSGDPDLRLLREALGTERPDSWPT